MRFLSFVREGVPGWGCVRDQGIVDLGAMYPQFASLSDYIASPEFVDRERLLARATSSIDIDSVTFEPVIPRAEKVICLSRNYLDHHKEAVAGGLDRKVTNYPPIFLRVWRSLVGHGQPLVIPKVSEQLDWEGELAVVIARRGRHISETAAIDYIAGYSCFNEGSVRDYQHHAYQITPGKNFAGTGPFGPYLVTPDELPNPVHVGLETRVNGKVVQSSNTSNMIFGIARIISYCSDIFELVPGDVLVTGTPSGVAWARTPQPWLKPGDHVEVEIEGVGLLSNTVDRE
ncbi:2-keto-4-pentenoate hydratase/2-oxohepta-3-ene-1,7-dioic acid hydratase in catechol pathway [Bradyrhizobium embrapense]